MQGVKYCYNNNYVWNSVYFHEKDYLDNIYVMNHAHLCIPMGMNDENVDELYNIVYQYIIFSKLRIN